MSAYTELNNARDEWEEYEAREAIKHEANEEIRAEREEFMERLKDEESYGMTYEKSYKYWKHRYEASKDFRDPHWECGEAREHREWCEHMENAFEALEKRIPDKSHHGCCPWCYTSHTFITDNLANPTGHPIVYCWNCGQAIDWTEEAEA